MSDTSNASGSLRHTLSLVRMDFDRRLTLLGRTPGMLGYIGAAMHRGGMAVLLFRAADYAHARHWRLMVRLASLAMYFLARAEIHAGARIGPGLVLSDVGGVGLPAFCEIGCNCTFTGPALLTIGGMEGIDFSKDRIVLGDHCIVGSNVRIIGAVTLGNGTQVKAGSVVMTSFSKDGYLLSGIPARRRAVLPLERVRNWNPLRGQPLVESESFSGKE